jgi:hypothetical protein
MQPPDAERRQLLAALEREAYPRLEDVLRELARPISRPKPKPKTQTQEGSR